MSKSILNLSFFKNSFLLLIPGVITSLLIVFISSGRWSFLSRENATWLIQIIHLQMLGITICKFGADQIGFALLQNNLNEGIEVRSLFIKRSLPLAIIFGLVISYFTNVITAFCLLISILFEVFNIITIVEHSALRNFKKVFLQQLVGYPFLLLLVLICSINFKLSKNEIAILLPVVTAIKFLISKKIRFSFNRFQPTLLHYGVPVQQISNFFLFKFDQILLSSILLKFTLFNDANYNINEFVYFTKYPELITGILTGLWSLYINDFSSEFTKNAVSFCKKNNLFLILLLLGILVVGIVHFTLGVFSINYIFLLYGLCFINCILILPVNLISFQLMKLNKINSINKLSLSALLVGIIILAFSVGLNFAVGLLLIVPVQLLFFVGFYFLFKEKLNEK